MKRKLLILLKWTNTIKSSWLHLTCIILFLLFNTSIYAQEWLQIGSDVNPSGQIQDISINSDGTVKAVVFRTVNNDVLRVYRFKDNSWEQVGNEITFPITVNHLTVSLSGNGNVVAFGRPQAEVNGFDRVGTVDIYNIGLNGMSLISHLNGWYTHVHRNNDGENDSFGTSIELNNAGNTIAIGVGSYRNSHTVDDSVPNSGILGFNGSEVRLYANILNNGFQLNHTFGGYFTYKGDNKYTGSGEFGNLVALSADGLTMATTGYIDREDDSQDQYMVRIFRYSTEWIAIADVNLPSYQIADLTLNNDGNTLALSNRYVDNSRGETEIYNYNGTVYQLNHAIKGSRYNDNLGTSIALNGIGNRIVLGGINDNGYSSGQVKIYEENNGTWNFVQKLTGDSYYNHSPIYNSVFGFKVDLSADGTTFIGASANSNEGLVQLEAFRYLSSQIPTNFSAENITTTSADVTWNYVVGPSSYILKYRKVGDTNWIILNETENTTIQIENLNYDTDYEAQIQHLYSDSNTSSFSSSLLFSTATPSINDLTYVPDDNFEQALIDEGLDNVLDNYVLTTNINSLTFLDVSYRNISDLTGIEDFEGLDTFVCDNNQISTLDLSNNHILEFSCSNNLLTSLILNADARVVYCLNNLLTSLNVPSGVSNLECSNNNITSLDLSKTTELSVLNVSNNNLSFLDFRNGENAQISSSYDYRTGYDYSFDARNNPELSCIFVDDASFCTTNWKKVDATSNFVANETACNSLSVSEFTNSSFRIFSNPVNENILISIDEKVSFLLSNINGKVLKKGKLNIGNNAINVSKFAKGIYFLRVNNQKKSTSKKIIIH